MRKYYDRACPACAWAQDDVFETWDAAPMPCPACQTATVRVWKPTRATSVITDEWPMGVTMSNGFEKPMTFFSRSAYHKALKANGFVVRGDGEEQFSWMSAQTLKNAEELARRQ